MKDSQTMGIAPHQTGMNTGPKPSALARGAVTPIHPRLLSEKNSATYLDISVDSLRVMVDAGRLRRVQLPGEDGKELRRRLFDRNDLDKLVDQCKDKNHA